jgi:hypothetical protein
MKTPLMVVAYFGLTALLGVGAFAGFNAYEARTHASAAVPAPPAGAQTPSAQFLTDYDQFLALSADVAKRQDAMAHSRTYKVMQDEQDRANGMAQRLTAQVPTGYTFDAKYRAFLLRAAPPAPAPPAPPVANAPQKAPQAKATPAH